MMEVPTQNNTGGEREVQLLFFLWSKYRLDSLSSFAVMII